MKRIKVLQSEIKMIFSMDLITEIMKVVAYANGHPCNHCKSLRRIKITMVIDNQKQPESEKLPQTSTNKI